MIRIGCPHCAETELKRRYLFVRVFNTMSKRKQSKNFLHISYNRILIQEEPKHKFLSFATIEKKKVLE